MVLLSPHKLHVNMTWRVRRGWAPRAGPTASSASPLPSQIRPVAVWSAGGGTSKHSVSMTTWPERTRPSAGLGRTAGAPLRRARKGTTAACGAGTRPSPPTLVRCTTKLSP